MAKQTQLIQKIIIAVLAWRLGLLMIAGLADFLLAYAPSFPYAKAILADLHFPRWVYSWGGFDGVHYLTIIRGGYEQTAFIQAFFPVWPLLLRLFSAPLLASLLLNTVLVVTAAWLLHQLSRETGSNRQAGWSVVALLLFPTSLFLGALYTEAFFLVLVLGSLLLARKKQWLWAGLLAGLASGTRITGVLLAPALLLELYWQHRPIGLGQLIKQHWRKIAAISLSVIGLATYMFYLWKAFGDPFYFLSVQSEFGAGRQESLVIFPQVIWRYLKILFTVRPFDWKYFSYAQDLVLSLGSLTALLVWWKKIRPSYLLFSLLAFFLPPLTGTLSSMPRYLLVCFPLFLLLGELYSRKPAWRYLLLTASVILLIINTLLFIQGYWVA